jgi:hypothetical protein
MDISQERYLFYLRLRGQKTGILNTARYFRDSYGKAAGILAELAEKGLTEREKNSFRVTEKGREAMLPISDKFHEAERKFSLCGLIPESEARELALWAVFAPPGEIVARSDYLAENGPLSKMLEIIDRTLFDRSDPSVADMIDRGLFDRPGRQPAGAGPA